MDAARLFPSLPALWCNHSYFGCAGAAASRPVPAPPAAVADGAPDFPAVRWPRSQSHFRMLDLGSGRSYAPDPGLHTGTDTGSWSLLPSKQPSLLQMRVGMGHPHPYVWHPGVLAQQWGAPSPQGHAIDPGVHHPVERCCWQRLQAPAVRWEFLHSTSLLLPPAPCRPVSTSPCL